MIVSSPRRSSKSKSPHSDRFATGFRAPFRRSANAGFMEHFVVVSTTPQRLLEPQPPRESGPSARPTTGKPDTRPHDLPTPPPASSRNDRTYSQKPPLLFDRSRVAHRMVLHTRLLSYPSTGPGQNTARTLSSQRTTPPLLR